MTQETGMQKYQLDNGEEIKLSPAIVKQYLVSGEGNVTDQELMMFMALCKFQKLNPFLREAYIIKYGDKTPATIVTGKEAFLKRAVRNPKYQGHKVGISEDGQEAWAEVYVEGYIHPIKVEVDFDEYKGKKKDGSITAMWKDKGRTMLKKVALVQALREAFPADFGGMYSEDELSVVQNEGRPATAIEVKTNEATEKLKKKLESKNEAPARIETPAEKEEVKETAEPITPPKGPASPAQIKKITDMMSKMGLKTEDEQLDWIGFNFEIQTPAVDGLSTEQANKVIKALEAKNG